ncbi:MAG: hypothetical protein AB2758_21600 [Candidatus Thiodiazotropha endolucinida]
MKSRDDDIEMLIKEHLRDELRIIGFRQNEPLLWGVDGGLSDLRSDEEKKNDEQGQAARDKVRAYRRKLRKMPQSDFDDLVKQYIGKIKAEHRRKEQQLFFNQPGADADFEYWGKVAGYKPEEAAALLLSKNPDKVTIDSLKSYSQISDFPKKYTQSLTLVSRAVSMGELRNPIQPRLFLEWAKQKKIYFPDELAKVIEECSSDTEIRTYEAQKNTITILEKSVSDLKEVVSSQKETIEILFGKNSELKEHYNELYEKSLEVAKTLKAERAKQQTPAEDQQHDTLFESEHWIKLQSAAKGAIEGFPAWSDERKKYNVDNIVEWIATTYGITKREGLTVKYVLQDIYPEKTPTR